MSLAMGVLLMSAYLIGSISGSLLLGQIRGVDIRTQGSGNAGATNALRTQGKAFALGTIAIDAGKGVLAALLLPALFDTGFSTPIESSAGILAAVLGHCFPIFFGFRGGKGAATALGGLAAIAPATSAAALVIWLGMVLATGWVGPSTATSALFLGIALQLFPPESEYSAGLCGLTCLLVFAMHRSNIVRVWRGQEPRFEKLWLLRQFFQSKQ
jgi:acyl phosphate:glycerol-3-phosphate acyltransferase